jgi:hypothetical protein
LQSGRGGVLKGAIVSILSVAFLIVGGWVLLQYLGSGELSQLTNDSTAEQGNEAAKNKITQLTTTDVRAEKPNLDVVKQRDPNDVVAQVLNYSNFGNDDGMTGSYWYQDKSDKCRYILSSEFMPRTIDLNAFDPRNITFQHQTFSECYHDCGVVWNSTGDPIRELYRSVVRTVIQHDVHVLFQTGGQLNLERLQRGWTMIYSKYCKGKQKPF